MGAPLVLVRGGGDLATGAAVRLHRCGFAVVVTEIERPLAVRRRVALAEAVYAGSITIEEVTGRRAAAAEAVAAILEAGEIPVLVDPEACSREVLAPLALVDGRMRKAPSEIGLEAAPFVVGLGPGFTAGVDCHAVVETKRGHRLGRVIWNGQAEPDTGVPGRVAGYDVDRVLRAPASGVIRGLKAIGDLVQAGEAIAEIEGAVLLAPFDGALRGLLHDGLAVEVGAKIGDLDPRKDPSYCFLISDKSLAVGGGVLEALLSQPAIRSALGG